MCKFFQQAGSWQYTLLIVTCVIQLLKTLTLAFASRLTYHIEIFCVYNP